MKHVVVDIGPGQIGQAIARPVGVGKHIVMADGGKRTRTPRLRSCRTPATT